MPRTTPGMGGWAYIVRTTLAVILRPVVILWPAACGDPAATREYGGYSARECNGHPVVCDQRSTCNLWSSYGLWSVSAIILLANVMVILRPTTTRKCGGYPARECGDHPAAYDHS
jgi:hypothetical protein